MSLPRAPLSLCSPTSLPSVLPPSSSRRRTRLFSELPSNRREPRSPPLAQQLRWELMNYGNPSSLELAPNENRHKQPCVADAAGLNMEPRHKAVEDVENQLDLASARDYGGLAVRCAVDGNTQTCICVFAQLTARPSLGECVPLSPE